MLEHFEPDLAERSPKTMLLTAKGVGFCDFLKGFNGDAKVEVVRLRRRFKRASGIEHSVQIWMSGVLQQKFEELFSKYDKGNKGYLTLKATWHLTQANRNVMDPVGW